MASPTINARTEYSLTSAGTSHTPTFTQTTGDAVLILIAQDGGSYTLSAISDGFTSIAGSANFFFLYKAALDGSEGGNVNYTTSGSTKSTAIAYNISGHSTSTTPEFSTIATGSSNNPDSSSLAPAGGSKDYMWLTSVRMDGEILDNDSIITGVPTNFVNSVAKTSGTAGTNSSNCCLMSAEFGSTASSLDPSQWSANIGVGWKAYTIAIYPVVAASNKFALLGVG